MDFWRLTRLLTCGVGVLCSYVISNAADLPAKWTFHEVHMGVDVNLTLYGGTEAAANDAARQAFDRIAELNKTFSDYDAESEAMRLVRTAPIGKAVQVSTDLWTVLKYADDLNARTKGRFDVTIGPVSKLWRRARRRYELPEPKELTEALSRVGRHGYALNPETHSVTLQRNDLQFDFGGLAKGYAAEAAYRKLQAAGFPVALVAVAGDMFAGEPPPGQTGWRIGIAPLDGDATPSRWLSLTQSAVSTSGDAFQFVEINGQRYSHIVDPRTGVGLTHRCSVTVVANRGISADALATTACVLGPEAGMAFVAKTDKAEAICLFLEDGHLEIRQTEGFQKLSADRNQP